MTMQHAELPHRQPKLMILYASYGEGHLQAALAVKESLARKGNDRTVLIDLMAEAHPLLNEMTRLAYRSSYTVMPGLYGWLYDRTRPMKPDSRLAAWLHSFGRNKLRQVLLRERPDAVLHTFPLFAGLAFKQTLLPGMLTAAVVTDYDLHCRWVHPGIDRYYVPTEDFGRELHALGIAGSRICVSGIPVKKGFRMPESPERAAEPFARYGLDPRLPLVLIMGGGSGVMSGILDACSRLLRMDNLQIAVICGRNEALRASAARRFERHPERSRLHLFGYVETMPELMPLASCLVTKPGGLTLAEGLAAGVPLFVYRPVPGQELGNASYLASKGAVEIVRSPARLAEEIMKLFASPERLTERRFASSSLGLPGGADAVAEDLLWRLGGYT
ncbi:diacylglycerol glucosyltransferase [Paenibacillus humicus]